MAVRPSTRAEMIITLVAQDTFEPVIGASVEFQLYDPAIGDFRTFAQASTVTGGVARNTATLPAVPGTYRYRARFQGTPEFLRDTSPEVKVEVATG